MKNSSVEEVVYHVGPGDILVAVGGGWDEFALRGGAPTLTGSNVLGFSLWSFVTDAPTQTLYRGLMARSRSGQAIEFTIHCDGPDNRRLLRMCLSPLSGGRVEFRTRVVQADARATNPLLDPSAARAGAFVRMCGWCNRVSVDGAWVEVEEAVVRMRLFERPEVPPLTHGICEGCHKEFTSLI